MKTDGSELYFSDYNNSAIVIYYPEYYKTLEFASGSSLIGKI